MFDARQVLASIAREIAASVDATPALLPVLAALFEGLDALGGWPARTCDRLVEGGLRRGSRVIDVACGKGATGVEVAQRLRCRVVGVDAFQPFLDRAAALARERGVGHLCRWRRRDARALGHARYDAAMMLGLFGFGEAAPILRRLVRRGGLYAIDDAVRLSPAVRGEKMPTIDDARDLFASLSDRVVVEDVPTRAEVDRLNRAIFRLIERNAGGIAKERPRLARSLRAFLERQAEANAVLREELRPVVWVVRKG